MRAAVRVGLFVSAAAFALVGCHGAQQPDPAATPSAAATVAAAPAPTPSATSTALAVALPEIPISLAPLPTQPGDIADSHDLAFLKRFDGAHIIGYVARPFDRLTFYDSSNDTSDAHATPAEGAVTRIVYRVPTGHSALEVLRNYEDFAKSAGMVQTSEVACNSDFSGLSAGFFQQVPFGKLSDPFYNGGTNPDPERPYCYFTARAMTGGHPVTLAVLVSEKHKYFNGTAGDGKPLVFQDGDVVVGVDVMLARAVANQMVKAADMADALSSKGFIDLYGFYFDTDQSAVKTDSEATLNEVASLLKIDRSLRLEVSGHTDGNGGKDHNLALSQARAAAIVAALTTRFGIDPSRLVAKGYGDARPVAPNDSDANRARNRRVQLRKL